MATAAVPPIPQLAPALLDDHRDAHADLAEQVSAAPEAVRPAFVRLSTRLLVEGLAKLQPVLSDTNRPLLVPAPRRFLSPQLVGRKAGATAAFQHIDSKVAMLRMGAVERLIEPSTPEVLNALLQGPARGVLETNPGLVRATPTNWAPEANTFEHPAAEDCRPLLDAMVASVADDAVPAVVAAGWLAFTMMSVHPFVDGNGRTARACALATLSGEFSIGIDWGILDQWCLARTDYVDALQAGQRGERYAAGDVDPFPFIAFTARSSTRGAELSSARLTALTGLGDELSASGLSDAEVLLILLVAVDRFCDAGRLAMFVTDATIASASSLDPVRALVELGMLAWAQAPTGGETADPGVVLGPRLADVTAILTRLRFDGETPFGDDLR